MNDFATPLQNEVQYLHRYAHVLARNSADADDLVQDCLARALAKQHLFRPGSQLRSWLWTVMRNQRVSDIRRSIRERRALDTVMTTQEPVDPSFAVWLSELDRAIAQLSDSQRGVLWLAGIGEQPYEQAAAALGVPLGTVRSRLGRARAKLRRLTDEAAVGEPPPRWPRPRRDANRVRRRSG